MAKRYYWLKLKNDWFQNKVIKKLRRIAGGDTYTIIYLKMQLLSLENEGILVHEGIEETFYQEIALILDEDEDNVRVTISFLQSHGLIEMIESDQYLMTEVPKAIGKESESASRVRKHRDKGKALQSNNKTLQSNSKALHCNANVTDCNKNVTLDIEKDIDKEIEIDKEYYCTESILASVQNDSKPPSSPKPEAVIMLPLNTGEEHPVFQSEIDEFTELYPSVDIMQALRNMRGWLLSNPSRRKTKRGIKRFVNNWLAKDQDARHTIASKPSSQKVTANSFHNFDQRKYDFGRLESALGNKGE